jgi:cytochrome P450
MVDLTFGESMSLLETQDFNPWLQGIFDQIFYACVSRAFQYFPLLWDLVKRMIPKSVHEMAEASVKHSADRVDKRLAMATERPDIFGLVLKHEAGSKMSLQEMHANADLLMIAGTETTATMLSGLTYHLLINNDAMGRPTREIREAFASGSDINSDALARLPLGHDLVLIKRRLIITVFICLSRRRPENIPVCRRRRTPQD